MSNFPTRAPVGLLCGGLFALLAVVPTFAVWHRTQPLLESFYLAQYSVSYVSGTPIGTVAAFFKGSTVHTYRVLAQRGHAVEEPVAIATGPLVVHTVQMESPAAFHAWLRTHIYHGRETPDLFKTPALVWLLCGACLFGLGAFRIFSGASDRARGSSCGAGNCCRWISSTA